MIMPQVRTSERICDVKQIYIHPQTSEQNINLVIPLCGGVPPGDPHGPQVVHGPLLGIN